MIIAAVSCTFLDYHNFLSKSTVEYVVCTINIIVFLAIAVDYFLPRHFTFTSNNLSGFLLYDAL